LLYHRFTLASPADEGNEVLHCPLFWTIWNGSGVEEEWLTDDAESEPSQFGKGCSTG
jgi:hypothetical protein